MVSRTSWSRRRAVSVLAASLATAACAGAPATRRGIVSINLTDAAPQPAAGPDGGALLETAFDQAVRMTVPVHVDGKGPFAFVVDTGANRSVIATEIAAFCRLPEAGMAPLHGIAGAQPAALVRVARLRVGAVVSTDLRLPILSRSRLGADGILGADMLRNRRVTLGFAAHSFQIEPSGRGPQIGRLTDSRIAPAGEPVTVPARYRSGQLVIFDAEAVGRPVTAFLDSGSQVTIGNRALRDAMLRARPDLEARIIHTELVSATGQRAAAEFAPLPALRLGGQILSGMLVAFADLHIFDLWDLQDRPTILIGVDVLRHFEQVALDFGRKQISFWPPRRGASRR